MSGDGPMLHGDGCFHEGTDKISLQLLRSGRTPIMVVAL
jgi:hypothetical protein